MKKFISIALVYAFCYLMVAFVLIEIDFTKWCTEARGFLMLIYVFIGAFWIA